jgi:hypothetical protein
MLMNVRDFAFLWRLQVNEPLTGINHFLSIGDVTVDAEARRNASWRPDGISAADPHASRRR